MITKNTPEQRAKSIEAGTTAERLLADQGLINFMNQFRYEAVEELATITAHDEVANNKRIAIANKLAGHDDFLQLLARAVATKQRIVTEQQNGSV